MLKIFPKDLVIDFTGESLIKPEIESNKNIDDFLNDMDKVLKENNGESKKIIVDSI